MLVNEIEKAGIPAVLITAMTPTAKMFNVCRIVAGRAITSPLGDPKLSSSEEKAVRRRIVLNALELLTKKPEEIECEGGLS